MPTNSAPPRPHSPSASSHPSLLPPSTCQSSRPSEQDASGEEGRHSAAPLAPAHRTPPETTSGRCLVNCPQGYQSEGDHLSKHPAVPHCHLIFTWTSKAPT
ncbi:hypothetical protein BS78_01G478800 [Paspalum vaginatum]|nr:hypothetical protein BS78_01G478800 [Paspalum vaginatum]